MNFAHMRIETLDDILDALSLLSPKRPSREHATFEGMPIVCDESIPPNEIHILSPSDDVLQKRMGRARITNIGVA